MVTGPDEIRGAERGGKVFRQCDQRSDPMPERDAQIINKFLEFAPNPCYMFGRD